MSRQQTQLDIMAQGGFDVLTTDNPLDGVDTLTPESLVILKETVEANMVNPCVGCIHETDQDPYVLDFCHFTCKEPDVEPIELGDEVTCCNVCGQLVSDTLPCDCEL
jgi:hypothetical protein